MKKNKLHYQMLIAVCLLIAALVLTAPHGAKVKKHAQARMFLGSQVQVEVCYDKFQKESVRRGVDAVWKRWEEVVWRMDASREHSDIFRINNSDRSPVLVSDDTYLVLLEATRLNQLTSGAFDITLWPLVQLWKESALKNTMPSEDELMRAKKNVGARNIRLLKDSQVKITNKDTRLFLENIATGYAADEAARILRKYGFENFLVDAGSAIFAAGVSCDGEPWKIAVKDPFDHAKAIDVLLVNNLAISIQGYYPPFFEINGEKYSHVIDPQTGFPEKKVVSSAVVAPSALEASAMAAALCVMDAEKGRGLIDRQGKNWASLVLTHEAEHFTHYESKDFPLYCIPQNP